MKLLLLAFFACLVLRVGQAAELGSHSLLAEVWKDASGTFVAKLNIGSPPQSTLLLLDLAQNEIWVLCSNPNPTSGFQPSQSTTFQPVTRNGAPVFVDIPGYSKMQKVADSFTFNITDGKNPALQDVEVKNVTFFCSSTTLLSQVASGMVGMGRGKLALPSLLSARLNLPRRFAYCLPGGTEDPTPLFIPSVNNYTFRPGIVVSTLLYAPFIKPTKKKPGYRLALQGINIGENPVKINPKVFRGGLEISLREPYTKLVRPAYEAMRDAFRKAENGIRRVPAVAPFDTCFNSSGLASTRIGPPFNPVVLTFADTNTTWPFFGASSMVSVSEDVLCLGFLDAGPLPAHSILGTYQQENCIMEVDLDKNQLGFYPSLLFLRTGCAAFNFTRSDI